MGSHHEVLGVSPDADRSEIRAAYRALLKEHHPDHGGSRERFLRITEAYEHLTGEAAPARSDGEPDDEATPHGSRGSIDPTFEPEPRMGPGSDLRRGLSVSGEYLTLSLSGLVRDLELSAIVGGGDLNSDVRRTAAFFEASNASDRTVRWRGRENTSFIGDDGFMYEGSTIVKPHAHRLPARWWAGDVELRPGRALNAIVVAGEIPEDVAVSKVVYTQHVEDDGDVRDTERYLFDIRPRVRDRLGEPPIDLEAPE